MPLDDLSHPLHSPELDLILRDGDAFWRWSNCGGDHGLQRVRQRRKLARRQSWQPSFQCKHIVAEEMAERHIQNRPARRIEPRCDITEFVARQKKLQPVDPRPLTFRTLPPSDHRYGTPGDTSNESLAAFTHIEPVVAQQRYTLGGPFCPQETACALWFASALNSFGRYRQPCKLGEDGGGGRGPDEGPWLSVALV